MVQSFPAGMGRLLCVLAVLGTAPAAYSTERSDAETPLIAPIGVTFTTVLVGPAVASGFKNSLEKTAHPAFADADGMTLYVAADNAAPCVGACAADWAPLVPVAGATAAGAWTIVDQTGGKQWAYRGHPVYIYKNDDAFGEATGEVEGGAWRAALIDSTPVGELPPGVIVRESDQAAGHILANDDGMPLYLFSGKHAAGTAQCAPAPCKSWLPLTAPALANTTGDFTVTEYEPGIRQWAYRGKPIYRYVEDEKIGDVRGRDIDAAMQVALVARYFMPAEAKIRLNHFGGDSLVSANGMTLYTRDSAAGPSGQNLRVGAYGNPAMGRALGGSACEGDCTKTWPPLSAPADAVAAGYWAPIRRSDGTLQWSYRGYALYTYTGDQQPGDITGFDIYQYAKVGETVAAVSTGGVHIAGVPPSSGLSQIHWRAVVP
jgi:predicted lipoprotein with Yx(FWY)xxD motif